MTRCWFKPPSTSIFIIIIIFKGEYNKGPKGIFYLKRAKILTHPSCNTRPYIIIVCSRYEQKSFKELKVKVKAIIMMMDFSATEYPIFRL